MPKYAQTAFTSFCVLFVLACPAKLNATVEEENQVEVVVASNAIENVLADEAEAAPAAKAAAVGDAAASGKSLVVVSEATPEQIESGQAEPLQTVAFQAPAKREAVTLVARSNGGESSSGLRLTPMAGAGLHIGPWKFSVRNQYTFGLALEMPVSRFFAVELEGGFTKYWISYTQSFEARGNIPKPDDYSVDYQFNQFLAGTNAKVYLTDTRLRPFIGLGATAVLYDVSRGVGAARTAYRPLVGYGSLMAGVDFRINKSISVGARAQWLTPLINRPMTAADSSTTSYRGYEEAAMINSNFTRFMGSVTIAL
ncbi:hypothetical protein K2X33_11425 [bacterium]|nr:hypothetical protein [bacterium]